MPAGMMLLTILAILVFCGLLQRVLDRMYLTDRQAIIVIIGMLAGTLLPNITLGRVSISLGGAVIPLAVCIWMLARADAAAERWRAVIGSLVTGSIVYALSAFMPAEAEAMLVEPMWVYGLCGGLVAWIAGRSRRTAFVCGVVGILLADTGAAVLLWLQGYHTQLVLGGAGIADATVISGVIAVLGCELLGESIERIVRMRSTGNGGRI